MSTTATAFNRDTFAKWYAMRHFETDAGVEQIHYMPTNSHPREIRFLEVNRLIAEATDPEPIDFGVDIGNADAHTLYVLDVTPYVLDVTPSQWAAIQKNEMTLPAGWALDDKQTFDRRNDL